MKLSILVALVALVSADPSLMLSPFNKQDSKVRKYQQPELTYKSPNEEFYPKQALESDDQQKMIESKKR